MFAALGHITWCVVISHLFGVSSVTKSKCQSLSCVRLFATPWTIAPLASLSMGFSRQDYWSGQPFPSPGHLLNAGIKPGSPALQADSLPSELPGNPSTLQFMGSRRVGHNLEPNSSNNNNSNKTYPSISLLLASSLCCKMLFIFSFTGNMLLQSFIQLEIFDPLISNLKLFLCFRVFLCSQ